MRDNTHIYTVSELCRETRILLEGTFLTLCIEGEISNLSRPVSGHIYFTLKDDKAQVQCAMFRAQLRKVGFKPDNGMRITLKARVSLYEARGNFQLIAEHMEAAGEGALRQQFEMLKNKLSLEGLYDEQHKKPLPELAKKVGVITSSSGAAIHDILTVLNNRFPALPVLIYPVTVQGDGAKNEIVSAIKLANERKDCDVLILARGGGSLEDLWAFNEEIVARAIYHSSIPIISAIGHEVDFTIADFVADHRAATPSAAAERVSPDQHQWLSHFNYLAKQLTNTLSSHLSDKKQTLNHLHHRLKRSHPGAQLQAHAQRLDDYHARLMQTPQRVLQQRKLRLSELRARLLNNNPSHQAHALEQRLIRLQQRLPKPIQLNLQQARLRFTDCNKGLETLSPLATLARGYSISKREADGTIVKNIHQVVLGEKINIQLTNGVLKTNIESIHENT
ncbi:MAG: exodeoxyribonuclease VII large subunit [Cycloclasticus pugetii]|jgi:exodeoxyribonuclease VII large subunit|uniref:Exodeoxyribonuclease 7 large subunit n=1 Tax=Cycloclasticus zancles 78-ME TaxID=1198232 RepID=S5T9B1_9GAMM|nr:MULTISPECIES: exodeoxyribonuclease VII large subunit [Cycloclasticus]AFT66651.1 Exodeoxyribonuclease 7 large subunit [Cycloclasticus sp. P1]AGS40301.1 Exodeoxyribonuclease VII large subunit [Cycloclasticus zancles 78-ME]MBV1898213.1 exodeoxyribonuclease VII large subunit [Cycloclasticus sp.]MDF1828660.1 exodeoxyribonuclease VII large subunit [Cycloclasticus pugetii]SHI96880.1 Exodeoxyribonuclease VII large subunit [Cycloclasticus pugetii]|tara:strand:+ start:1154 stop:2500 length:1347 start_codon:yes stop_codon:yes gene_type:complete